MGFEYAMDRTVIEMLHQASKKFGNRPYVCVKTDQGYQPRSFRQVEDDAYAFASSLLRRSKKQ